jgi:hypothetical protein
MFSLGMFFGSDIGGFVFLSGFPRNDRNWGVIFLKLGTPLFPNGYEGSWVLFPRADRMESTGCKRKWRSGAFGEILATFSFLQGMFTKSIF